MSSSISETPRAPSDVKCVDLHTHTRFSDGTSSPADLVKRAKSAKVEFLVLTDHDTISGFQEGRAAAEAQEVKFGCGIEINTVCADVHILGYGFDWKDVRFHEKLAEFRERRRLRVRRMVESLRGLGLDIAFEDVEGESKETLGRPHVADALRRKSIVSSRKEAFERFLARGKPGYVEPMGPSPEEAIGLIRETGGIPVLAHPDTMPEGAPINEWIKLGLAGIEAYYGAHSSSQIARYLSMADELELLAVGGTDFHGPGTGRDRPLGIRLPSARLDRFMERLSRCPGA